MYPFEHEHVLLKDSNSSDVEKPDHPYLCIVPCSLAGAVEQRGAHDAPNCFLGAFFIDLDVSWTYAASKACRLHSVRSLRCSYSTPASFSHLMQVHFDTKGCLVS